MNSDVTIRDLCPNATNKCRNGTITKVLGPLNYKVKVDGYTRQAHIDHILPCPQITSDPDNSSSANTSSHVEDDILMPLADSVLSETNNDTPELVISCQCRTR